MGRSDVPDDQEISVGAALPVPRATDLAVGRNDFHQNLSRSDNARAARGASRRNLVRRAVDGAPGPEGFPDLAVHHDADLAGVPGSGVEPRCRSLAPSIHPSFDYLSRKLRDACDNSTSWRSGFSSPDASNQAFRNDLFVPP